MSGKKVCREFREDVKCQRVQVEVMRYLAAIEQPRIQQLFTYLLCITCCYVKQSMAQVYLQKHLTQRSNTGVTPLNLLSEIKPG